MSRDRLTWWAYGVIASFVFVLNGFGPVLDDLREELDVSRGVAGLHSTALATGMIVAGLAGERLRARLGWTRLFWCAAVTLAAGVVLLGAGGALPVTLAGALVIGAGGTLLMVMAPGVLSQHHGDATGVALSEANGTASLLGVLAPLAVAGSLAVFGAWEPVLVLVAFVVVPLLGRFAPTLTDLPPRPATQGSTRLPGVYWSWWTALLFGVAAEFAILLWAADDAQERLGMSDEASALAPAGFLVGMGVARWTGARLLLTRAPGAVFAAASAFAMACFTVYHVVELVPVALLGVVGVGLGVGLLYPTSLTAAMGTAAGAESQAAVRSALASGIAIGAGPLALGALADATSIGTASWIVLLFLASGIGAAATAAGARSPGTGP